MIIENIKKFAKILSDKDFIEKTSLEKDNFLNIDGTNFYPYELSSMSHGLPGLCFLFNELSNSFPEEEDWLNFMNDYLQQIVRELQKNSMSDLSLFSGLAGIGTLVNACSKSGQFYSKIKISIDSYLKELLNVALPIINGSSSLSIHAYDAIQGLSGILNYFMLTEQNRSFFENEINEILDFFIGLSQDELIEDKKITKWLITPENLFLEEERMRFPDGVINLGLSHGISGPLVVMSSALQKGIKRSGLSEAVQYLADILISSKNTQSDTWPGMIDINDFINSQRYEYDYRDAWCYGRPGVAFALLKAGLALDNKNYYSVAVEAMKKGIENEKGVISPTFCHGYSGLAYMYFKFFKLTGESLFYHEAQRLTKKTADYFDDQTPFGFQNIEYNENSIKKINSVGLLDGISGVYLVLLSIMTDKEGDWEAMFLLN